MAWLLGLLLILGLGVVLRGWNLGGQSLWFDEGYTAWVVTLPATRIIQTMRADVSPPLYYLVLSLWRDGFGESETALRSLSAVAGCLTLLILAALAWRVTRHRGATLLATFLAAISVLQVQYAQEARSYGLATFLAAAAVYGAVRRLDGRAGWLGVSLLAALASVYLHNMMWFYLGALNLFCLLAPGKVPVRRRIVELAGLNGVILLFYLPWLPALLKQMQWLKGNFWASVPGLADLGQVVAATSGIKPMHVAALLGGGWHLWALLGLGVGGVAVLSAISPDRKQVRWALAIAVYGLFPIVAVFIHAHWRQSFFVEKVFTASTLAMPLLAGLAVMGARGKRWVSMLPVAVLLAGSALSLWGLLRWEAKENWRDAMAHVNSFPRQGTLVVFVANEGELLYDYYTRREGRFAGSVAGAPQGFFELDPPRTIQRVLQASDTDKLAEKIRESRPERVLLVYSHWEYSDPEQFTKKRIEGMMSLKGQKQFLWVDVYEYGGLSVTCR